MSIPDDHLAEIRESFENVSVDLFPTVDTRNPIFSPNFLQRRYFDAC